MGQVSDVNTIKKRIEAVITSIPRYYRFFISCYFKMLREYTSISMVLEGVFLFLKR